MTKKYLDMGIRHLPGEYEIISGDNVHLTLSPAFSIKHSLEDTKKMIIGSEKQVRDYEINEVYVKGSMDLDDCSDLFSFQ
ncbi:MAG: hypothetical protein DRP06_01775 [Candidatus Aenigmatarchaeota archaeon]|nr:MAG: hypothetical protein DRP06_01775 [Candidatus Aenigmarchaeota archaeon]